VGSRSEASYYTDVQIDHAPIQKEFALAVIPDHVLHAAKEQSIIGQKNQSTCFLIAHTNTSPSLCQMFYGMYLRIIESVLIS
jgi:hypothetical protein